MCDPIHLLMRFADKLTTIDDTVGEHGKVIRKHGAVWLGKLGKHLAEKHIATLNGQCRQGIPTYVYLVQKAGRRYDVYRGRIATISLSVPRNEQCLVPKYYELRGIAQQVAFWIKLASVRKIPVEKLRKLHVAATGTPVPNALARSMAGLFILRAGESKVGDWGFN